MGDEGVLQARADGPRRSHRRGVRVVPRASGVEEVDAVATSAIRDAANRDELLDAIRERTGLEVRVISGAEEARYGYLAIANSLTLDDGFGIDVGGGSVQLMRIADRRLEEAESVRSGRGAGQRGVPRGRGDDREADQGASQARGRNPVRVRVVGRWRGAPPGGDRGHDPQPRHRGPEAARAAGRGRAGLRPHARGARGADRAAGLDAGREAGLGQGHQAGPRRRDPRGRGRPRRGDGARRLRAEWRSPRPACARGSSSSACSRTGTRRCSRTCGASR